MLCGRPFCRHLRFVLAADTARGAALPEVPDPADYGLDPACVIDARFDGADAVFRCYSVTHTGAPRYLDGERETHEVRWRASEQYAAAGRATRRRSLGR